MMMDELLQLSDMLWTQLLDYEHAMSQIMQLNYFIMSQCDHRHFDNAIEYAHKRLLLSQVEGVKHMYDLYRQQKGEEILQTKAVLLTLAERAGLSPLVEPAVHVQVYGEEEVYSLQEDIHIHSLLDKDVEMYRRD